MLGTSATKEVAHAVARLEQTMLVKTSTGHCTGLQMSREDEGYFTGEQTTEERDLTGNHAEGGEQVTGEREEDDEGISEEEEDDVGGRPPGSLTDDRFTHSTAESQPLPSDRVTSLSEPSVNLESAIASEEVPTSEYGLTHLDTGQQANAVGPPFDSGDSPDLAEELRDITQSPSSVQNSDLMSDHMVTGKMTTFNISILGPKDKLVIGKLSTRTLDTLSYEFTSETLPNGMLGPDFPDYLSDLLSEARVTPFPSSTQYADPSLHSFMQPVGTGEIFPTPLLGSKDELVTGMPARTMALDTLEYDPASETGPRCKPASSQSAIRVPSTGIMNVGGQICDPPFHVDDSRHCALYQHPDCKSYGSLYP